jgi:hypothetical protein
VSLTLTLTLTLNLTLTPSLTLTLTLTLTLALPLTPSVTFFQALRLSDAELVEKIKELIRDYGKESVQASKGPR